jgi:phenylacetate-CoA ligase
LVVEIVDKQGNVLPPGESGEIVITHLFTSEFPFVRYRTGDIGVLGTSACQCGRGLPILASVEGRSTDFVVTADGAVIHGLALIYILRDVPEIEAFRIVQESIHHTRVELVTKQVNQQLLATSVVAQFRARLGQDVEVEVAFLESLTPEKSGKFRYVISKVAQGS